MTNHNQTTTEKGKKCKRCGKEFYKDVYTNEGKKWEKRKYCSRTCSGMAIHPRIRTDEHVKEYFRQRYIVNNL